MIDAMVLRFGNTTSINNKMRKILNIMMLCYGTEIWKQNDRRYGTEIWKYDKY